ncbi:hypothetical protein SAMN05216251_102504 [Actinacidiphila alni]|uniref:Tetratricopeptide repeat protein n=1 Tax=Actinacidiphila alni TaxID=380248 RepID=A0A1I1ZQ77_9ACTN|nr:tetratricopeptide repeat protein [Actinacidiphila alni]SFE32753.1 hypothetical protein SAMN05216251_102504 [Actinacidiphila alni]
MAERGAAHSTERDRTMSGPRIDGSWIGGHNIQIGDVTGDVAILLERPLFRLEILRPGQPAELPDRVRHQPSYLLHPGSQVVPYRTPTADLARLARWRDGPEDLSVLLLHGPGGQGKTRTAQHFASRAAADGWSVAQARDLTTTAPLLPRADGGTAERLLIVVDYAERWSHPNLLAMLDWTRAAEPARVIRVLLLSRTGTHLWDRLDAELDGFGIASAPPIALSGFSGISGPAREHLFAEATDAFAHALDIPARPWRVPDDLADASYASPLTLHMAALAAVLSADEGTVPTADGVTPRPDTSATPDGSATRPADISRYLLLHEQRAWNAAADTHTMRTLVVLATLFGPFRTRESARRLLLAAAVADSPAEADRALRAHGTLYPAHSHLAPLHPDRFGEDFLGWHLDRDPAAADDLAALLTGDESRGHGLRDGDIRQAMIVLANAARHTSARDLLNRLVFARVDLAESTPDVVLAVAGHLPPAAALLIVMRPSRGVELAHARLELVRSLVAATPADIPALAAIGIRRMYGLELLACGETGQAADVLGEAVRLSQAHLDDAETTDPEELAELLHLYTQALVGHAAPCETVRTTVESIRTLRAERAGRSAADDIHHTNCLAGGLSNYAKSLHDAKDPHSSLRAAEEARELYRELVALGEEQADKALVRTQARISSLMHDLGRFEDAVRTGRPAVDALRRLFADDADTHREHLAVTLYNLALSLEDLGEPQEAAAAMAEAAEHYRYLTQHIPRLFLAEFGSCLFHLAGVYETLHRTGELIGVRLESATVDRQLRDMGLVDDDRRLAITLLLLGQNLEQAGSHRQALSVLTEGLALVPALPAPVPDRMADYVNSTLIRLSRVHNALGDHAAGLVAARDAVGRARLAAPADGTGALDGPLGTLGFALEQLANCLPPKNPEHTAAKTEFMEIFGLGPDDLADALADDADDADEDSVTG